MLKCLLSYIVVFPQSNTRTKNTPILDSKLNSWGILIAGIKNQQLSPGNRNTHVYRTTPTRTRQGCPRPNDLVAMVLAPKIEQS